MFEEQTFGLQVWNTYSQFNPDVMNISFDTSTIACGLILVLTRFPSFFIFAGYDALIGHFTSQHKYGPVCLLTKILRRSCG